MLKQPSSQSGMTLVELIVVVALAALIFAVSAEYSGPMIAREATRSAALNLQTHAQLARLEAVQRNRDCRLLIDEANRAVTVMDTLGTASLLDDLTLHRYTLPSSVEFARPDGGSALTVDALVPPWFQVVYASDGTIADGTGEIHIRGGDRFIRIAAFGAGGTRIERWTGYQWITHQ